MAKNNNDDLFNSYLKIIENQISLLEQFKVPPDADFEQIVALKNNLEEIKEYTLNYITEVLKDEDKLGKKKTAIIYAKYDMFEKQLNHLVYELNFNFLDIGIKLKKQVETESKNIAPQIISFSSLFIAVVGLIISNIILLDAYTLKNILVTDLTFVFAITLIFYYICLLWSNLIDEKNRKKVLFIVFPIILIALITSLILIGIFM